MPKSLLLADISTPFAYLSLFTNDFPASNTGTGHLENRDWLKKRELIFSTRDKSILQDSADQQVSSGGLNTNMWGDDWLTNLIKYFREEETIKRVDYLALGRGPGLFTSLRIAHVVFRMLSLLWNASTIHFSSLLFWHKFFCLKQNDTLIIRANRNLYYIYTPDRDPSFLAMIWPQWLEFAKKNKLTRAFIWNEQDIQESKDDLGKTKHETHNEINIEIQELSLTTQIEENKGKENQEFISDFINFADIENMTVPLKKFLPKYGQNFQIFS